MRVIIRKAEPRDAEALSGLFAELMGFESDTLQMGSQLEQIASEPHYYVAVAELEQELAGTAMGIVCRDLVGSCAPFLLIENVIVSQKSRGSGVGRLLMQALEGYGKDHSCSYTILASSNERIEAHRFYENIGYSGSKRGFIKHL
ncbi:GNAT family N-acetyltransferase [Paenibacillus pasadenensis]|uniref:GNAT family N-acetyltransferase n=1 Tax=Paenibacillus pasadenensis TaxID=217090 RepID=UPI00203EC4C2|nr:GNAT family N-acetyltransferase [Paenibacillus pasadenensis]MCM3747939.1 GNAT family N-acetyltransferase [Paenibacillus pasadenensis]